MWPPDLGGKPIVRTRSATPRYARHMPSKRRGKTSSLPAEIQRQIDDVHAGRSTTLSLEVYDRNPLTEIPQAIQDLTELQSLYLADAAISTFPPWLDQLPNLELIDIRNA